MSPEDPFVVERLAAAARTRTRESWASAHRRIDPELSEQAALRLAEAPIAGIANDIWLRETTQVVAAALGLDLEGPDGKLHYQRLRADHSTLIERVADTGADGPLCRADEELAHEVADLGPERGFVLTEIAAELMDVPADCAPALHSHPVVRRAVELVGHADPHAPEPLVSHDVYA